MAQLTEDEVAIGASTHAIYLILSTEALVTGLLSWFLAVLIAPL